MVFVCEHLRTDLPSAAAGELDRLGQMLPGFAPDRVRAYELDFPPLGGSTVVLAAFLPGATEERKPQLLVAPSAGPVQRIDLPGLEPGWNLVQTLAVGACDADADGDEDVLVLALLEPLSGRSQDYWSQGFVFLSQTDGTLAPYTEVNDALARLDGTVGTLEAIRDLLRSRTATGRGNLH
jgi:hypothetical protein